MEKIDFQEKLCNLLKKSTIKTSFLPFEDNIDELIDMQINLCDNFLLDFNLIQRITELLNINEQAIQNFIQKMILQLKSKNSIALNESQEHILQTMKLIIFLYTVILNISNETLILKIFNSDICNQLLILLINAKKNPSSRFLAKIILNLFLEDYNKKFSLMNNDKIKDLFAHYLLKFSGEYNGTFEKMSNKSYKKFFDDLMIISIEMNQLDIETSNAIYCEKQIAQALIEVIFSKELVYHCKNANNYRHDFLFNIIKVNMVNTKNLFSDKYTTLYRKDEFSTEVIKHLFMCLGNYCYITSFVTPFTNYIEEIKEKTKEGKSTKEELIDFDQKLLTSFIEEMLMQIEKTLPPYLKVVMKMVYINVNEIFTIEKDNYAPLFTALIFNYFLSPKIQEIYGINSTNYPTLTNVNRVIRNVGYNILFLEKDEYYHYNSIIPSLHEKFHKLMKRYVVMCEEKDILREFQCKKTFELPNFLFLWNSHKLIEAFKMKVSVFEEDDPNANFLIVDNNYFIEN